MRRASLSLIPLGCLLFVGSAFYLLRSQPGQTTIPKDFETVRALRQNLRDADAVILGKVVDVQYRMSAVTSRSPSLPHTFVTYEIEKNIMGKEVPKQVTLRFLGGPDQQGNVLEVRGVPIFQRGQQDVLFLRQNGESDCPLVRCGYGRYQVFQGNVYDYRAVPVVGVQEDVLQVQGQPEMALMQYTLPQPPFETLLKNPEVREQLKQFAPDGNLAALQKRYEQEAPKLIPYSMGLNQVARQADAGDQSTIASEQTNADQGKPMSIAQFLAILTRSVDQFTPSAKPIVSLNPDRPFQSRMLRLAKPNEAPSVTRPPSIRETSQERQERLTLEKQDFNPVIKQTGQQPPVLNPDLIDRNPPVLRAPDLRLPSVETNP